jgi:hypothetical protein
LNPSVNQCALHNNSLWQTFCGHSANFGHCIMFKINIPFGEVAFENNTQTHLLTVCFTPFGVHDNGLFTSKTISSMMQ